MDDWKQRLPEYRSHKIVRAAAITAGPVNEGTDTAFVELRGGITAKMPSSVFARGTPQIGDYIVVYDDGYVSWSPKAAFEGGYSALADEPQPERAS